MPSTARPRLRVHSLLKVLFSKINITPPSSLSNNCGSPATVSSIGSPLTPNSTSASMSLLPNIHSPLPLQGSKFNSSSDLTYHFGLEPALGPSPSTTHHPRLRSEQEHSYGYHSPMDISIR